jgi:uncharacterized spore protein YtfJ
MIPSQDLVFGDPVTVWGKTIVPVIRMFRFRGERCVICNASPVAVLIVEGNDCWFAPLCGKLTEADLREALIPG